MRFPTLCLILLAASTVAAQQRPPKLYCQRFKQSRDPVEAGSWVAQRCIQIAAPVDFDLECVDAACRPRVTVDDVPAGEGVVEAGLKA